MNTDIQIPELSFESIEEGDFKSIELLGNALNNHGFFSITDHGLSQSVLDQCYKSSKDFFNLPEETKKNIITHLLKVLEATLLLVLKLQLVRASLILKSFGITVQL